MRKSGRYVCWKMKGAGDICALVQLHVGLVSENALAQLHLGLGVCERICAYADKSGGKFSSEIRS